MISQLSPLPDNLVNKYRKWKSRQYSKNSDHFKSLEKFGQHPLTMIISCCDSRVHPTSIFGADEGDFFIHRNIANLVPPYSLESDHFGTFASIEYGIKELKIKHLIVLGHTDCGGIKSGFSLHSNKLKKKYDFINKWLDILLPVFKNIPKNLTEKKRIELFEEENIKFSLNNLLSFPDINKSVKDNKLFIHGLIHNIGSGELKFLDPVTKKFENL